jgi:hypothetical protein
MDETEAKKPSRYSEPELAKVGVEIIGDKSHIRLACKHCGQNWSPNIQPGGRLPRGYWKCPNGCNSKEP